MIIDKSEIGKIAHKYGKKKLGSFTFLTNGTRTCLKRLLYLDERGKSRLKSLLRSEALLKFVTNIG